MALAAHLTFSLFTLTSSLPKIPGRQLDLVKSEEVKIPNAFAFGIFGDPAEIRTPDTLLKRQVLCRLSYWVMKSIKRKTGLPPQLPDQKTQKKVAGMAGLEPASEGVKVPCLTTWLHPCISVRWGEIEKARTGADAPALTP